MTIDARAELQSEIDKLRLKIKLASKRKLGYCNTDELNRKLSLLENLYVTQFGKKYNKKEARNGSNREAKKDSRNSYTRASAGYYSNYGTGNPTAGTCSCQLCQNYLINNYPPISSPAPYTYTTNNTNVISRLRTPITNVWDINEEEIADISNNIEQAGMPILATRYAGMILSPDGVRFRSAVYTGNSFGVDEVAKCTIFDLDPESHKAPVLACSCGFYAVPADMLPTHNYSNEAPFILQVELSGTVIVHETGYRAERQRVCEVKVPRCCCGNDPMELWFNFGDNPIITCNNSNCRPSRSPIPIDAASRMLGVPFTVQ